MEMRYFWLLDSQTQKLISFKHHPGEEILADYPSKAHNGAYHHQVRPLFLHTKKSPRVLLRAKMPSEQRGCVKKPEHTCLRAIRKSALPSTCIRSLPTTRIKQLNIPATNSALFGHANLCHYSL
jgi:hypothetical protein